MKTNLKKMTREQMLSVLKAGVDSQAKIIDESNEEVLATIKDDDKNRDAKMAKAKRDLDAILSANKKVSEYIAYAINTEANNADFGTILAVVVSHFMDLFDSKKNIPIVNHAIEVFSISGLNIVVDMCREIVDSGKYEDVGSIIGLMALADMGRQAIMEFMNSERKRQASKFAKRKNDSVEDFIENLIDEVGKALGMEDELEDIDSDKMVEETKELLKLESVPEMVVAAYKLI